MEFTHSLDRQEYKALRERLTQTELYVIQRYYLDGAPFRQIVNECRAKPETIYRVIECALIYLEHIREEKHAGSH